MVGTSHLVAGFEEGEQEGHGQQPEQPGRGYPHGQVHGHVLPAFGSRCAYIATAVPLPENGRNPLENGRILSQGREPVASGIVQMSATVVQVARPAGTTERNGQGSGS